MGFGDWETAILHQISIPRGIPTHSILATFFETDLLWTVAHPRTPHSIKNMQREGVSEFDWVVAFFVKVPQTAEIGVSPRIRIPESESSEATTPQFSLEPNGCTSHIKH